MGQISKLSIFRFTTIMLKFQELFALPRCDRCCKDWCNRGNSGAALVNVDDLQVASRTPISRAAIAGVLEGMATAFRVL